MKHKTQKENIGSTDLAMTSWDVTPKAGAAEAKINKVGHYIKVKCSFCIAQKTIKKIKKQSMGENVY